MFLSDKESFFVTSIWIFSLRHLNIWITTIILFWTPINRHISTHKYGKYIQIYNENLWFHFPTRWYWCALRLQKHQQRPPKVTCMSHLTHIALKPTTRSSACVTAIQIPGGLESLLGNNSATRVLTAQTHQDLKLFLPWGLFFFLNLPLKDSFSSVGQSARFLRGGMQFKQRKSC